MIVSVARELTEDGFAAWRPVPRVGPGELAAWIGRCDRCERSVQQALIEITAGRVGWIAEIWHEWRMGEVVFLDHDGWRFSPAHQAAPPDSLAFVLGRRLQTLVSRRTGVSRQPAA